MVEFGIQQVYDWLVQVSGTPVSQGSQLTWGVIGAIVMLLILWLRWKK